MFVARSACEILDEIRRMKGLGSDAALGELFGVRQSTVSSWRTRNSLPYEEIIAFCIKERLSTDCLFLLKAPVIITKPLKDRIAPPFEQEYEIDDLFSTRLKHALQTRSIEWLAKEADIEHKRLLEFTSDICVPTVDELIRIADAIGVSPHWLAERSTISSENWMFEYYKGGSKDIIPADIFRCHLLETDRIIESMLGLIKVTKEQKADVIITACRVHMKETPNSTEVNPELIRYLLMLPR